MPTSSPFFVTTSKSRPLVSEETIQEINAEIRALINTAHDTARQILTDNREIMETTPLVLLKKEPINNRDMQAIINSARS